LGPRRRIVDRDLVAKRAIVASREAFRHARSMGRRAVDAAVFAEIGRLDDQCGAFPLSARVAHVAQNCRADMRTPIDVNNARLMNHLVADHDDAGRLYDLIAARIADREHRAERAA